MKKAVSSDTGIMQECEIDKHEREAIAKKHEQLRMRLEQIKLEASIEARDR